METAVEIIVEERQNRSYVSHIIMCSRLMTQFLRKALRKDADLMFTTHTGFSIWCNSCHETLCIYLILPIIRRINWKGPWVIRGSQLSGDCTDSLEGGIKVAAGRIPPGPPFIGR